MRSTLVIKLSKDVRQPALPCIATIKRPDLCCAPHLACAHSQIHTYTRVYVGVGLGDHGYDRTDAPGNHRREVHGFSPGRNPFVFGGAGVCVYICVYLCLCVCV